MLHCIRFAAVALIACCAYAGHAAAQEQHEGYPLVPLFSTGKTIVGETIHYPTSGPSNVTAAIVTVAVGGKTIMHEHGVPLFAYVLDGELTVDYGSHGKRVYRQCEAIMEAIAVPHFGRKTGAQP